MESEAEDGDSCPASKRNRASSDSSFSGWSSSSDEEGEDDVVPPPPAVANAAISSSVSDEMKVLSDDDQEEEEDDVGGLLDSLPRERLISLLLSSADRNAKVRHEIRRSARDDNPANCKIAVRNLPWRTTSQDLHTLFSQYGAIKDCHVATECSSGRSKGFGFVHFFHPNSASRALQCPHKRIGGRAATCLLIAPRHYRTDDGRTHRHIKNIPRKIYVARVEPGVDKTRLYEFFSRYGEIEEGPIGFDKYTGKSRGYAMFVYKTEEGACRALEEPMKNFEGYLLHCQPGAVGRISSSSGFRSATRARWLSSGPDSEGYWSDGIEAPPGYEDPWCCS